MCSGGRGKDRRRVAKKVAEVEVEGGGTDGKRVVKVCGLRKR